MSKTNKRQDVFDRRPCKERTSFRNYRRMCKQDTRNALDSPEDYSPLMYGSRLSYGNIRMRGQSSDPTGADFSNY